MLWGGRGDSDRNRSDEEKMMVDFPCKMEAPTNGTLEHPYSLESYIVSKISLKNAEDGCILCEKTVAD